ncbi:uncharacterized protein PFL1_03768 [Pseudozyma flocculosa PF-1]|uniref:BTB domain-containing protein n=2 Tax=Pseudozyma flocculosa TaxID=84751 RepID=A0A5C3EVU0_9BASI|nr:uncharacterized protein PFL1_03768 [Pseudozyma flocculosa PF-1]EPQ28465.1 hypothetical protein PFL1_03768 [Pseudozyma flocculosa PF-1]SPO36383.1 uncharacterized protein PSFLO_01854 [Pseudozyma flocculosa]
MLAEYPLGSAESLPRVPPKTQVRTSYRSRPTMGKPLNATSASPTPSAPAPANVEKTAVSEHALEAIHHAISGQPWADLELIVSHGSGTQSVFANSNILKKACPVLMKEINRTGALELDTMEDLNPVGGGKSGRRTASASLSSRPTSARRTSSSGLLDYSSNGRPRERAPGSFNRRSEGGDEYDDAQDSFLGDDNNDDDVDREFPRKKSGAIRRDDNLVDDDELEHEDDVDEASSYLAAGHRVAKVPGSNGSTPVETPSSPFANTFSKARLSRFVKFMGKDKTPDALESPSLATGPVVPGKEDYLSEGGRVRRYSAANDLYPRSGEMGANGSRPTIGGRAPAASRVHVSGCTPGTLQALIFYLYTGQTRFARKPTRRVGGAGDESDLSSDEEDDVDDEDADHDDEADVPEASGDKHDGSKSQSYPPLLSSRAAYCLGHQLNLPDLQARAFAHLCGLLSSRTVLGDLLSPFVDRFAEVQQAHLDYISKHWDSVKSRDDFAPIIGKLVKGEYPKANAALLQLFAKFRISP